MASKLKTLNEIDAPETPIGRSKNLSAFSKPPPSVTIIICHYHHHNHNPHKGTGPNGIHTEILKLTNHLVSDTLSNIFNMYITSGKHPDKLKLAHALPIFKKGSRLLVSNYRPISLLSNLNQ